MMKKIQIGRIQITFSNRWLYTLIALGILMIIIVGVYAVDKTKAWHSVSEIDFGEGGIEGDLIIDGKIGIGTTSPTVKLDIVDGDSEPGDSTGIFKIRSGSSSPYLQLHAGVNNANDYAWIQATEVGVTNNRALLLNPRGGNVGIGTTSPSAKLDVNGEIKTKELSIKGGEIVNKGDSCSESQWGEIKRCNPSRKTLCTCAWIASKWEWRVMDYSN